MVQRDHGRNKRCNGFTGCGGHSKWRKHNLSQLFRNSREGSAGPIILAVNDTASSSEFQSKLRNLPNILFVADEVHALGSKKN